MTKAFSRAFAASSISRRTLSPLFTTDLRTPLSTLAQHLFGDVRLLDSFWLSLLCWDASWCLSTSSMRLLSLSNVVARTSPKSRSSLVSAIRISLSLLISVSVSRFARLEVEGMGPTLFLRLISFDLHPYTQVRNAFNKKYICQRVPFHYYYKQLRAYLIPSVLNTPFFSKNEQISFFSQKRKCEIS